MPLLDYLKSVYIWIFKRKVIRESLRRRKGECKQCGKCCNFFGVKCPFLTRNNRCMIYKHRPKILCALPPLGVSKGNIKKHKELNCGYYWDDEEEQNQENKINKR